MATDTEKVMGKVQALLRKAESTNFGPESEALIAKAHELMARYSIEEAMLHTAAGVQDEVIVMSIPVKRKGAVSQERHVLLAETAKWQRCRAIITGDTMSVVGFRQDTEFVRTLYESLVLQMMDSMLAETNNTENWNRSFCRGFVNSVAERMEQVYKKVEVDVAPSGSSTALVLVDRGKAVEKKTEELFPNLGYERQRTISVNGDALTKGMRAGRNADVGATKIGGSRKELT